MERLKYLVLAIVCGGGLVYLGVSLGGHNMDRMATILILLGGVICYLCACMAGRQGKKHSNHHED
jgi:hypothetical protein